MNSAIAFNVWQYFEATGDLEFLSFFGAPMLVEIARFWASLAAYDASDGRFHIRGVVGPDEYHTRYPGSEEPGVDDNAYTNVMAAWTLRAARRALEAIADERRAELFEELGMTDDDAARFEQVAAGMYVPFLDELVMAQFEGYAALDELDWESYRRKYGDIQRIDRILEAEGDTPNRFKASKQADVLMLFYLLSSEELGNLLAMMGYPFDSRMINANIEYYSARTSHGSTLSRVVHAWVLSRSNRTGSYALFRQALASDTEDVQGGTTAEGIHLGAMAGTVDIAQRCYSGIEMRDGVLWLNPRLPDEMQCVDMHVRYRGHWLQLHITGERIGMVFRRGWSPEVRVGVNGTVHSFSEGQSLELPLSRE